ncbi:MAG: MaoC family dehydratase [Pseudomonadota bacterium]
MSQPITLATLAGQEGAEIGVSRWFALAQEQINRFAALTEDAYFIHTDPARARAETPFGGTVAHGFFTLSFLSAMSYDALPEVAGKRMQVNYGFDRIRFVAPVPAGARIRGRFALSRCQWAGGEEATLTYGVTVEIADAERPAVVADWVARIWGAFGEAG